MGGRRTGGWTRRVRGRKGVRTPPLLTFVFVSPPGMQQSLKSASSVRAHVVPVQKKPAASGLYFHAAVDPRSWFSDKHSASVTGLSATLSPLSPVWWGVPEGRAERERESNGTGAEVRARARLGERQRAVPYLRTWPGAHSMPFDRRAWCVGCRCRSRMY